MHVYTKINQKERPAEKCKPYCFTYFYNQKWTAVVSCTKIALKLRE